MHQKQGNLGLGKAVEKSAGISGAQSQTGTQRGNYVNPNYLGREQEIIEKTESFKAPSGESAAEQIKDFEYGGTQMMQYGGQTGLNPGQQAGWQTGQQTGQQMGWQTGQQTGTSVGRAGKFGAHEIMMTHEVLIDSIDGINQFELYRPHVKDQQLMQILDNQVNHMYNSYQNIVNYLHNQGAGSAVPYRAPKTGNIKYGLRQPSPVEPNVTVNEMDDRDVASGMMGCAKASAMVCTTAALECSDPALRSMVTNGAVSSINQAYELFQYMNEKGMYQVPTLADTTTQTMVNTFSIGSQPQLGGQMGMQAQLGTQTPFGGQAQMGGQFQF